MVNKMKIFIISGMTCSACATSVEKATKKVSGVSSCQVNLLTNSMIVEGSFNDEDIINAVNKAGYFATLKNNDNKKIDNETLSNNNFKILRKRLIFSIIFLILLMYISMGHVMFNWPLPNIIASNHIMMGLIELLLTSIIIVINQSFFINGYRSLFHFAPNMDTLVALGVTASYGYSTWILFEMTNAQVNGNLEAVMNFMHDFYFESAAMILTLITVGKMLEAYSKGKTTNALKSLMDLAPKTAIILDNNIEKIVPIDNVKKDDIFIVKPGESIPVDGIIIEGNSSINEASLTGESIPVDKEIGDTVSTATINQSGYLKCKATRVGEDTTLAQIIQMVSDASASKAPIAKIADKVSGVFVPIVMIISLITLIIWLLVSKNLGYSIARAVTVLVISCPCALGLATPVAIMVGSGIGAKNGILYKTASSLEEAGKASIVVLDKTGTITLGQPKVTDIIPMNTFNKKELLILAYSLEIKSEHPLAKAIIEKSISENINPYEINDFKILPGNGLIAYYKNQKLIGGSFNFIKETIGANNELTNHYQILSKAGKTPLFFALENDIIGIIAVADTIKPDSIEAIKNLKKLGIQVLMLTGDNENTALAIGNQIGVDRIIAQVLPDGKEKIIKELKQEGKVIMVGDGINDALALTTADIGIAIGAGTDVAIDAADIVLMKNNLNDVANAINLSKKTLLNIYENLFWAFIYNIIGIPLAAGAFIKLFGWELNPMFGAAAMSLSSVCVVLNALRLNLFKAFKINESFSSNALNKTISINGMSCMHCVNRIKTALESIDEVNTVNIDLKKKKAYVTLNNNIDDDILRKTIENSGYKVIKIK